MRGINLRGLLSSRNFRNRKKQEATNSRRGIMQLLWRVREFVPVQSHHFEKGKACGKVKLGKT
jgi:hypothetical protein